MSGTSLSDAVPWGTGSFGQVLLAPTVIYVRAMLSLMDTVDVKVSMLYRKACVCGRNVTHVMATHAAAVSHFRTCVGSSENTQIASTPALLHCQTSLVRQTSLHYEAYHPHRACATSPVAASPKTSPASSPRAPTSAARLIAAPGPPPKFSSGCRRPAA